MSNVNQKFVPPYSQKEIDELTPGDIDRGCLKYRLEVNNKVCALEVDGNKTDWLFYLDKDKKIDAPVLPLKLYDEVWHKRWDISTRFAIDANNKCWKDNAHGGFLCQCSSENLIQDVEDESERNTIRTLLGEKENLTTICLCCRGTGYVKKFQM